MSNLGVVDLSANDAVQGSFVAPPGTIFAGSQLDSDLNTEITIEAGGIPPTDVLYSGSPSDSNTVEARTADEVSDTAMPITFHVQDDVEFSGIVSSMDYMSVNQACNVFSCATTIIPKVICIGKAIASGGSFDKIWNNIKGCGITAKQACSCATCVPGLGTVLEAVNVC